jgi:hypothetical protein
MNFAKWGAPMILIGLGSYLLPMLGFQFILMQPFQQYPAAGIIIAILGLGLCLIDVFKGRGPLSVPTVNPSTPANELPPPPKNVAPPSPQAISPVIAPSPARCARCDHVLAAGDRFCEACGASVPVAIPPPAPLLPDQPVSVEAAKNTEPTLWLGFIGLAVCLAVVVGIVVGLTQIFRKPTNPGPSPVDATTQRDSVPNGRAAAHPRPTRVVSFSDSFQRAAAGPGALGVADNALGGQERHFYLPLAGVCIVSEALQHSGLDHGGVQFAQSEQASRGEPIAQDLNIRVDLLVPTDAAGMITQAGPYFRGRAAARGDELYGGENAGCWVALHSTGEVFVKDLNRVETIASTGVPASFDPNVFHTLEIAARGGSLQVTLDHKLLTFDQFGGKRTTVSIPPSTDQNAGTAGIYFAAEPNRGKIGGQRARNLVVSPPSPLSEAAATPSLNGRDYE